MTHHQVNDYKYIHFIRKILFNITMNQYLNNIKNAAHGFISFKDILT